MEKYDGWMDGWDKGLRAERIEAGATVVEIGAPVGGVGALDVVTVGVLGQGLDALEGAETVVGVHDLKVAEVAGLSEPIVREVTRPHLGGRVLPVGSCVHHLPSPLHHRRMIC